MVMLLVVVVDRHQIIMFDYSLVYKFEGVSTLSTQYPDTSVCHDDEPHFVL